jgi:fatty acid desaturase
VLVAIPVIGTQYYGLAILGHDGVHKRLAQTRRINNLVADISIYSPVGLITERNGRNHLEHHAKLGTAQDPDRYKYTAEGRETLVRWVLSFSPVRMTRKQLSHVVLAADDVREERDRKSKRYSPRDIAILISAQAVLIGGLTWVFGWWGWPLLWLLPVGLFMVGGDTLRSYCEHSWPSDEGAERRRLITFRSSPIERVFFAPHGMNFHAAHHLWVSIPCYNLAEADALLRERAGGDPLTWRRSYVGHIVSMTRRLPIVAVPDQSSVDA